MTHPWGRPLLFNSPEELQEKIQAYFDSCFELQRFDRPKRDKNGNKLYEDWKPQQEPYQKNVMTTVVTVSGLALALKTSRETLINYEEREKYFDTIKDAKQFIEWVVEWWLLNWALNSTGCIFNLKNNYWRKDKTELDSTLVQTIEIIKIWSKNKK